MSRAAYVSALRRHLLGEAQAATQQRDVLMQSLMQARMKQKRTVITAPADGMVQQLALHTVGGVVSAGQQLCLTAPGGARMEVQAHVDNSDIAFVKLGQPVEIKVKALDFTRYGTLKGRVASISQAAIQDENGKSPYWARVTLDEQSLRVGARQHPITQGMLVSVEIKTGERRLIEYLLGPLIRGSSESFKER